MDRLIAQDAIHRTLLIFNAGIDTLSPTLLKSALHPTAPATFDASKNFPGATPVTLPADQLWAMLYSSISGFSGLQHLLGAPIFTFPEDGSLTRVTVACNAWAYHCVEHEDGRVESVTTRVVERAEMVCEGGKWFITTFAVERDVPLGAAVGVFGVAKERFEKGLARKAKE